MQAQEGTDPTQLASPPPPQGVDQNGWKLAVNAPPLLKNGSPWPVQNWAAALGALQQDPTPDVMKQFDEKFVASGVTAKDMLDVLGVTPQAAEPAKPNGEMQPGEVKDFGTWMQRLTPEDKAAIGDEAQKAGQPADDAWFQKVFQAYSDMPLPKQVPAAPVVEANPLGSFTP